MIGLREARTDAQTAIRIDHRATAPAGSDGRSSTAMRSRMLRSDASMVDWGMMPAPRSHPSSVPSGDPPAHRLLLACARAPFDPAGAASAFEELTSEVEWEAFLRLAGRNRMLPLAHRALGERTGVPETVRSHLRSAHAENARHALLLAGELRRLMDALQAAGIPALAYKGPALAVRAYGHLALRTYSDLDLLVAPSSIPAAAAVLRAHGYASAYALSPAQDAAFRRVDGDYPYHHPATGGLVELHARVSSTRFVARMPTEQLLARARAVPIGGGDVPAPADDDLFLALCLHGAKHRWTRLEWLACAAALAIRAELDLEALVDRADAIGARRTVLLALRLAHDELDLSLPPSIERAIEADRSLGALAAEARDLWFGSEEDGDGSTPANLRFNARLRDGGRDRARYVARWLFLPSPEDWAWARLPDALAPLYRVLRPVRLAMRYGRRRDA